MIAASTQDPAPIKRYRILFKDVANRLIDIEDSAAAAPWRFSVPFPPINDVVLVSCQGEHGPISVQVRAAVADAIKGLIYGTRKTPASDLTPSAHALGVENAFASLRRASAGEKQGAPR